MTVIGNEATIITPSDNGEKRFKENCLKSLEVLSSCSKNHGTATVSNANQSATLPAEVADLFVTILTQLTSGNAVQVIPTAPKISTQVAAEILGISRPTFIKLLDDNVIPYEQARKHRKVELHHVLEYAETMRKKQAEALDSIERVSEKLGLYDIPDEEFTFSRES